MALAQVRLVPVYRRLSVTPADALVWLAITKPPGAAGSAIAVITLLTAFASWIAFRSGPRRPRGAMPNVYLVVAEKPSASAGP